MNNYKGILKNKTTSINVSNVNFFIDNEIFIETVFNGDLDKNYFGIDVYGEVNFWNYFQYNKKEYTLNPKVYFEYFENLEKWINVDYSFKSYPKHIEIELETLFENERIDFLIKLYKSELNNLGDLDQYHIYKKSKTEKNTLLWYNFLINEYQDEEFLNINISKFLTDPNYTFDFKNKLVYQTLIPLRFLYKIYNDIEKLKNQNSKELSADNNIFNHIFKDNKYYKFHYIINEFKGKKNTAFFSQLFKYFQYNDWLNINVNDSKEYREFIIDKYNLDKFSKIQQKTSYKTDTKWDKMYQVFNDILLNYS